MTRLILIRHGETDWNTEGRWQGQIDLPINARGLQQAKEIAEEFRGSGIEAIYASDLQRALQTAEIISHVTGVPVQIDARLREIHQGQWQGLQVGEIKERFADAFHNRQQNPLSVAAPGGETAQEVRERVIQAMEEIVGRHLCETVVLVMHGFTIAVTLAHYKNIPFEQVWDLVPHNAGISTIDLA
jgi:broad specificity phosphatase PhoE